MLGRFRLAAARYPDDPDVRALPAECVGIDDPLQLALARSRLAGGLRSRCHEGQPPLAADLAVAVPVGNADSRQ
jgi:hypothetical protein